MRNNPQPGEIWLLLNGDTHDPFPPKPSSLATVLDVKEGWVRYKLGSGFLFNDERMEIKSFIRLYAYYQTTNEQTTNT